MTPQDAAASARPPAVCWHAPGRVNVIGEHTDYNDGFVLPIALPLGVTACVRQRGGDRVSVTSAEARGGPVGFGLSELEPGSVPDWAAYVAGVFWAVTQRGHRVTGADVALRGDLPQGAGLSSSAALECAVAAALNDLFELQLSEQELIDCARAAENDYVGVPTGSLDQSASMLCTERHALLLDTRSGERRQVPFDLHEARLALLVIDVKAPHRLVDGEYAARRADCERAAAQLQVAALRDVDLDDLDAALHRLSDDVLRRRVRHVVTENDRVLRTVAILESGDDIGAIGALLTASHVSLRDDYEVSCPELDTAVDAALTSGALGARMTGGGFGGSAIALVRDTETEQVGAAVQQAFAAARLTVPDIFPAQAAPGARRVDVPEGTEL